MKPSINLRSLYNAKVYAVTKGGEFELGTVSNLAVIEMKNKCNDCPYIRGLCCRIYTVPVYPEDIKNGVPEEFYTIDHVLGSRMKKKREPDTVALDPCICLDNSGQCTIYDNRPKACREWVCENHGTTLETFAEWGKGKIK